MGWLLVCAGLPVLGFAAAPATTEQELAPKARARFDRGEELLQAERYSDAAAEFSRAHAIDAAPFLLFMQGRAEQLAGNCEVAIGIFERFVATSPPTADVEAANAEIVRCGGDPVDAGDAGDPAPTEPVAPPPPRPHVDPTPTPDLSHSRPARRDALGHALLWSGTAVALTGAALLIAAHTRRAAAIGSDVTEGEHEDLLRPAAPMSRAGLVLLPVGSALVVGGIVRFLVVRARSSRGPSKRTARRRAR